MGLTMECAACHDHKYDPISMRDFYGMFAFFNQVPERGLNGFDPRMKVVPPLARSELARIDAEIAVLRNSWTPTPAETKAWVASLRPGEWAVTDRVTALRVAADAPEKVTLTLTPPAGDNVVGRIVRVSVAGPKRYLGLAEVEVVSGGENIARAGKATQSTTGFGGPPRFAIDGNTSGVYSHKSITHTVEQKDPWWEVDLGRDAPLNTIAIWNRTDCCPERLEGFRVEVLDADRKVVWFRGNQPAPEPSARFDLGGPRQHVFERRPGLPADVRVPSAPVAKPAGAEVDTDTKVLAATSDPAWTRLARLPETVLRQLGEPGADLGAACRKYSDRGQAIAADIRELEATKAKQSTAAAVSVMVMQDMPKPRATHILKRGQYDQKLEAVTAGVPEVLPPMAEGEPRNRLGFARWLVRPDHPLTARVIVNRTWQRIFGVGLVKSAEDFGVQGERPSHPELLDWLAVEFVESGWDLRHVKRLIVSVAPRMDRPPPSTARDLSPVPTPPTVLLGRAARGTASTVEVIRDNGAVR